MTVKPLLTTDSDKIVALLREYTATLRHICLSGQASAANYTGDEVAVILRAVVECARQLQDHAQKHISDPWEFGVRANEAEAVLDLHMRRFPNPATPGLRSLAQLGRR